MNEQQLVEALDPYITELLDVIKRLDVVEARQPEKGEDGKDADVDAIIERMKLDPVFRGLPAEPVSVADAIAALKADSSFVDSLRAPAPELADVVKALFEAHGEALKGEPGNTPEAPTVEAIVTLLFELHAEELKGKDGNDADPVDPAEVAKALAEDPEFVAKTKAKDGEPGDDADPLQVASALLENQTFIDLVKAADPIPGKNADPAEVAAILKGDEAFVASLTGAPGEAPAVEDVVTSLLENKTFIELTTPAVPERGKDADPAEVAATLKADPDFVASLAGAPGETPELPALIEAFLADPAFTELVTPATPEPGKAADPHEVAAILKNDPAFLEMTKGDPGDTPEPLPAIVPENGKDGKDGAGIHAAIHIPNKVYREGDVVTAFIGQYFRAKCDTAQSPGDSDEWDRIGTAGFRWHGLKPEEKSLSHGSLFIDGGSLFGLFGEKPTMMVQRGKAAPTIRSVGEKDGQIVLKFSDGTEVCGDLPVAKGYTLTVEKLEEKVLVLDEALKNSEKLVAKLMRRLEAVEKHLSEEQE